MRKLHSYFPEFLYEGIIQEVDYSKNTCHISPLSPKQDTLIKNVTLPYFAGSGNSGIWMGNLKVGSRVIVANTSGEGQEFAVIIGCLPQTNLFQDIFNTQKPTETPSGVAAYPEMAEGRIILRGDQGSEIGLIETGDIYIKSAGGGGEYYKRYGNGSVAVYRAVQESSFFTNAGRFYSGTVRRLAPNKRNFFPKTSLNSAPLFVDLDFHTIATPIGFFNGSKSLRYTYGNKKRNPEIAESRWIINEFSTESMFTGFDDEVERASNKKKQFENSDSFERYREPSNNLQLAEGELIEIIGGNLVDFKGNILDINYRNLAYGSPGNQTPKNNIEQFYEGAKRISRRGIGMHFQLSTNVVSKEVSTNQSSFLIDIDKEGLLRLNVPKSSDTGNVPFPSLTTFENGANGISSTYSNPSTEEPIPVTLRDKDGNIVLPIVTTDVTRKTGIRYANSNSNPYFPSSTGGEGSGTIRVNSTKYHNMYSIAERLIANNISEVVIPVSFVNDEGLVEGNSFGKPFEIYDQEEETSDILSDLTAAEFQTPTFMSVVKIVPAAPAIYSGGETVVAGTNLMEESRAPAYSNSFTLEKGDGDEFIAKIVDPNFGDEKSKVGGKSASLNFEGAVETSIGSDNTDQKSLVLDTAGSLIAWLGKDRNGRSMVLQTDGEMLINVGGSYEGSDLDDRSMNVGKFVLRVNVTDKKFIGSELEPVENPRADSDFFISISEEGLIIAGMKTGVPMIIRNEGKILIESSSDLVLKGQKVEQVDAKGRSTTPNVPGRG